MQDTTPGLQVSFLRQQFFLFCLVAATQGVLATGQLWSVLRNWRSHQAMRGALPAGVTAPPFEWPWLSIAVAFFALVVMVISAATAIRRWKLLPHRGFAVLSTRPSK